MELIIDGNEAARGALKALVAEAGISLSALGDRQGIAVGSLTRFANNRTRTAGGRTIQSADIHLLTFLKALDGVGYEVVVRPKVTGSRRERRLKAMKERANGRRQGAGTVD